MGILIGSIFVQYLQIIHTLKVFLKSETFLNFKGSSVVEGFRR